MRAADWDEKWRGRLDEHRHAELTGRPSRFVVSAVEGSEPGRALDLACGAGRHAVWLAERGWQVTAVDFSEIALAEARRLAAARAVDVEWIAADVLVWEPPAEAFELVLLLYLQVPAHELRTVLERATRALAPGGRLVVVGHHADNLEHGHGGELLFGKLGAHVVIPLEGGGYLVDTPGFSEVGMWGVDPRSLAECFPDFRAFLGDCRYADCRHRKEPGCRVREALEGGAIAPDRYESYLALLRELEEQPRDWE